MAVREKLNIKETDNQESESPPNSTALEINTVHSVGYLYEGFNQSFIYVAKACAGGEGPALACL